MLSTAAVVSLSLLHSLLIGWIVYALMRRNESRQEALVGLYSDAAQALKDYFAGTAEGLSGGMQRLLEIAAAMSQGQAQLLGSLGQTLLHDHASRGLRLVELLLPAAREAASRAGMNSELDRQIEAALRISSPAMTQPASAPVVFPYDVPADSSASPLPPPPGNVC